MKSLIIIAISLWANFSLAQGKAEILTCYFQDPTFTISFNSETKQITYEGEDPHDEMATSPVQLILSENGKLVTKGSVNTGAGLRPVLGEKLYLFDSNNNFILEMTLSFQGSDGVSQLFYPFDAIHSSGHDGGCASTSAPAADPVGMFENLR